MLIEWLTSVPGDKHRAQCRYCKVEMSAEINVLKKHGRSAKHHKIMSLCKFLHHHVYCGCRPFTASSFPPFLLFPFFRWLYLFSSFVNPFPFYQNSPTRFQARGRRRRPNLGLVCFLFSTLCYLYSLVKMDCGALFYLV